MTEWGKTIGQIVPVKPTLEEPLQAMVAAGQAEWNGQKLKPYQPKAVKATPAKAVRQNWAARNEAESAWELALR